MKYSEEEKAMWLEDWRQSGKNAWAYARENGLIPQTFGSWTKSGKETKQVLVEIPTKVIQTIHQEQEIFIEKGSMRIHIPLGIGTNELRAVMEGLGTGL
jgi:transposase-like protein